MSILHTRFHCVSGSHCPPHHQNYKPGPSYTHVPLVIQKFIEQKILSRFAVYLVQSQKHSYHDSLAGTCKLPSDFETKSRPCNGPAHLLDADLLTSLLVIVIPFTLAEFNASKRSGRLDTLGLPFALYEIHKKKKTAQLCIDRLTSGLNSVNSKPRQSSSMIFLPVFVSSAS